MGLAKRIAEKGLLSKERVQKMLEAAQNNKQSFLREALETGEIDRAQLLQCASEDSGLPLLDLKAFDLLYSLDHKELMEMVVERVETQ